MVAIESVFPSSGASGVPVGVPIFVIFDEEIDPTTVGRAFLIEGPDTDRWTGPDLQLFDRPVTPEPEYFLDSPDYKGIVQGTFSITKLDTDGNTVTDATYSYGGAAAFKNKVTFTPTDVLSPSTEYTVVVSGDELDTDDIKVGLATRTVYDTQLGANTGDGEVVFSGGYTDTIDDEFVVEITVAGNIGTATYRWYRQSDPLTVRTGTTSSNAAALEDGVEVVFDGDSFATGDMFRVVVRPPQYMSGSYTWSFQTGSGSIVAVPESTSTSVIGDVGSSAVDTEPFDLADTNPKHLDSQISLDTDEIVVDFTDSVDPDTITQESVKVFIHPVRGPFTGNSVQDIGEIPKILELSENNTRLTIKI